MLRRAFPDDLDGSGFQRAEVVARAELGLGASEDRHVGRAVFIEMLDAPLAVSVAKGLSPRRESRHGQCWHH
jgi:hypothetical protein